MKINSCPDPSLDSHSVVGPSEPSHRYYTKIIPGPIGGMNAKLIPALFGGTV